MTEEPTTKEALLARIHERWEALQSLISVLTDGEMEQPLGDGWSAKVHLGHLAAWERSLMGLLRKQHRGEAMGLPRAVWDAHDLDATNALLAKRAFGMSLDEVRAESAATHTEVIALLESMSQEALEKPYSFYQSDDLPFNGNPVAGWAHGNTWDHYDEHIGWLEAGLKG